MRSSFFGSRAVFLVQRAAFDLTRTVFLEFTSDYRSSISFVVRCLLLFALLLHRNSNRKVRSDKGKKHKSPEGDMQAACVEWMKSSDIFYVASANGAMYANGFRTANSLKKRGVEPGVPDLLILELGARGSSRGILAVELKHGDNEASDEQALWLRRARKRGHGTKVVFTLEQFKRVVLAHVNGAASPGGGEAGDPSMV